MIKMKVPKIINTYCPKCDTHTEHVTSIYKAGKRKGAKLGERRQAERKKGYWLKFIPQTQTHMRAREFPIIDVQFAPNGSRRFQPFFPVTKWLSLNHSTPYP